MPTIQQKVNKQIRQFNRATKADRIRRLILLNPHVAIEMKNMARLRKSAQAKRPEVRQAIKRATVQLVKTAQRTGKTIHRINKATSVPVAPAVALKKSFVKTPAVKQAIKRVINQAIQANNIGPAEKAAFLESPEIKTIINRAVDNVIQTAAPVVISQGMTCPKTGNGYIDLTPYLAAIRQKAKRKKRKIYNIDWKESDLELGSIFSAALASINPASLITALTPIAATALQTAAPLASQYMESATGVPASSGRSRSASIAPAPAPAPAPEKDNKMMMYGIFALIAVFFITKKGKF